MDIAVVWDTFEFRGQWAVTRGDLAIDPGGLRSAVLMSLFTDRLAPPGFVPPPGSNSNRRGWWGDTYQDDPIGSWLWTLERSKKSGALDLLLAAQDMCQVALQWLVKAKVVASVAVRTSWQQPNVMAIAITLTQPDGRVATFNFGWAWTGA